MGEVRAEQAKALDRRTAMVVKHSRDLFALGIAEYARCAETGLCKVMQRRMTQRPQRQILRFCLDTKMRLLRILTDKWRLLQLLAEKCSCSADQGTANRSQRTRIQSFRTRVCPCTSEFEPRSQRSGSLQFCASHMRELAGKIDDRSLPSSHLKKPKDADHE